MEKQKPVSLDQAKRVGDCLHIDWGQIKLEEFRQDLMGYPKEAADTETEFAYEVLLLTGKVVLAHVQEFPDYYARLAKLEAEVDDYRVGITQRLATAVSS